MTYLFEESILRGYTVQEISCVSECNVAALFHYFAHLSSRFQALIVITCAFDHGLYVQSRTTHGSPTETHNDTRGTNFVVSKFGCQKKLAKLGSDTDPDPRRFIVDNIHTYQWYI
jgi:hypothetical protein